jgi:hypothetical protein
MAAYTPAFYRALHGRLRVTAAALLASVLVTVSLTRPCNSQVPFLPGGNTVTLAVTGTSARVQFQTSAASKAVRLYNGGTVAVFIACGDVASVATIASGMPVAPGSVEVIGCAQQYVAGISAGTAATLYVTPGDGL